MRVLAEQESPQKDQRRSTALLVSAMLIFGTLGLFVRFIPLPSAALALARGFLGSGALWCVARVLGRPLVLPSDRRTRLLLVVSGVCLTLNWAFLFEAYRLTTLATAELAYEMAPVFVMVASPFVLGERLTPARSICLLIAVFGMVLVSGVLEPGAAEGVTLEGVALALVAAAFYASVMLLNQFLGHVDPYVKTIAQLLVAGVVLVPYAGFAVGLADLALTPVQLVLLLVVGVVHTGAAFALWFGGMRGVPAQKVAILGYVDPLVALLISALVFGETLTPLGMLGAAMVLGATLASELASG